MRGIEHGTDALADALKTYSQDKANAAWGDTVVDFLSKNVPGSISPDALERYHKAGMKEKAQIALAGQWNAIQGLGAYNQMQAIKQPFVTVNGQLMRRPGAPVPVNPRAVQDVQAQQRFNIQQQQRRTDAQVKLAESEAKNIDAQLSNMGYTGDYNALLDSSQHKGGVTQKDGSFLATDPAKGPQNAIQIGGTDVLDMGTFNRAKALAARRKTVDGIINQALTVDASGGGAGTGGGASTDGGIVTVNSPQEAQQLQPGTKYRAANWPPGRYATIPGTPNQPQGAPVNTGTGTTTDGSEDDGSDDGAM